MVKSLDSRIVVREFELQSRYYIHFRTNILGKGMNPFILPAMGWTTTVFLKKNAFGIKIPEKVDMPLNNKQNKNSTVGKWMSSVQ